MTNLLVSLPSNWEEYLERLADEHDMDVGKVISGLCEWAFTRSEYKAQFEIWLDKTYPSKGQAIDEAKALGEEAREAEEEREVKDEEEPHEDRDYSEDKTMGIEH